MHFEGVLWCSYIIKEKNKIPQWGYEFKILCYRAFGCVVVCTHNRCPYFCYK